MTMPVLSRRLRVVASMLSIVALGACNDDPASPDRDDVALLRVPEEGVERSGNAARVAFTVENRSAGELRLMRCGEFLWVSAERQVAGAWQQYVSGICPAIYEQARTPLAAGQSVTGIVSIAQPGRYRLSIDIGNGTITSAPFDVR